MAQMNSTDLQSALAQLDLSPANRQAHNDLFRLEVEGQPTILLTHPDHARYVYSAPHRYPKAVHRHAAVSNDDERLLQLRLLRPQYHRKNLAQLCELMVQTIDRELDGWSQPDSPPLDLAQAMSKVTREVLIHAAFGAALPEADYEELGTALVEMVEHSPGDDGATLLRESVHLQEACATFDRVFDKAIALYQQADEEGCEYTSLLAMLLGMVDVRTVVAQSVAQLREELLFDFFVGFENIATALTHAFQLLLAHPNQLARLQQEVDEILHGELPTLESLHKLPYSGMVLEETLRLHPAVHWLRRRAVVDDQIAGEAVPAGTMIIIAAHHFHYNPEFWQDPTRFDPERFNAANRAQHHPCAWLPFGGGQRFCLGKDFAIMEGKLILAMTMQRFNFTVVDGG